MTKMYLKAGMPWEPMVNPDAISAEHDALDRVNVPLRDAEDREAFLTVWRFVRDNRSGGDKTGKADAARAAFRMAAAWIRRWRNARETAENLIKRTNDRLKEVV